MFLFLTVTPFATVVSDIRTSAMNASLYQRISRIPPLVLNIREQFSNAFLDSQNISEKILSSILKPLGKNVTYSTELIYPSEMKGDKCWLHINLIRGKVAYSPVIQNLEVSVGSDSILSDEVISEIDKYSFALYKFNKAGNDSMTWHKPFDHKNFYRYSVDLDLDNISLIPSDSFKATVRRNYFPDCKNGIAILIFKRDEIGTNNNDYLLIYDA